MNLHGVGSPEDGSVGSDGDEESAELVTLGAGVGATVKAKVPEDEDEGNAGNCVPAPLLGGLLRAEGSEKAGEDHDDVGNNGDGDVGTGKASEQGQVEEKERSGDGPVNVAGPVDLAVNVVLSGRDVLVVLLLGGVVVANAVAAGHGEVGESGDGDDEGGQDVIQTLGPGRVSGSLRCFDGLLYIPGGCSRTWR